VDEFAQDLLGAFAVVAVPLLAEEGAEFGPGDNESGFLEYGEDIVFLQVESDTQLFEDFIIGQEFKRSRNGSGWVGTAFFDDEAVQEPTECFVGKVGVAPFVFALEPVFHFISRRGTAGQGYDSCDLRIIDVQGIAQPAQGVVIGHRFLLFSGGPCG